MATAPVTPSKTRPPEIIHDTPIRPSTGKCTSAAINPPQKFFVAAREMKEYWRGPIKVEEFLDKYLPPAHQSVQFTTNAFAQVPMKGKEVDMYAPLIDGLAGLIPMLSFVNTSAHEQKPWGKVDIGVYKTVPDGEITAFDKMLTHIEIKIAPDDVPHKGRDLTPDSQASQAVRGQLVTYATAIMNTQFRLHTFSVFINRNKCCLYYWDRSHALVTEPFNYINERWLAEFFWRLAHAPPTKQGYDPSAQPTILTSPELEHSVQQCVGPPPEKGKYTILLVHNVVNIPKDEKYVARRFIVSEPFVSLNQRCPHGRSTRPYRAFDYETGQEVIVKDTWRVEGYTVEHETYAKLQQAKVPYIPTVIAAGDVLVDGKTYSIQASDNTGRQFIPYRIVFAEKGQRLIEFKSIHQLVTAVSCAFKSHRAAVERANILHRDISIGNIMLQKDGGGLLIDWEMAKDLSEVGARAAEITGTWQFISARLQSDPTLQHNTGDDVESFFHVMTWIALRYIPNRLTVVDRAIALANYEGRVFNKIAQLSRGGDYINGLQIEYQPFTKLLATLADQIATRYDQRSRQLLVLLVGLSDQEINDRIEKHGWMDKILDHWLHATPVDSTYAQEQPSKEKEVKALTQSMHSHLESLQPSSKRKSGPYEASEGSSGHATKFARSGE